LTLHFDRHDVPSAAYRLSPPTTPAEPLLLEDPTTGHTRAVLSRAGAVEAALTGRWHAPPGAIHRGESAIDELDLAHDGGFVLRLAGGVVHPGTWSFERTPGSPTVEGTLTLDPHDLVFPIERWRARLGPGYQPALEILQGEPAISSAPRNPASPARRVILHREQLTSRAFWLVGRWRIATTEDLPSWVNAHELVLHPNGTLEIQQRPGGPRLRGRWAWALSPDIPGALEGTLDLTVTPATHPATRERWLVRMSREQPGELRLEKPEQGPAVRFRRIFR
jgi:hypothetical protein